MKPILRAGFATACLLGVATLVTSAAPQAGKKASGNVTRIGQFFIRNAEGEAEALVLPNAGTQVTLRGQKLEVTSSRYDIAAPKIVLNLKRTAAATADATGGVRIAVRNPEESQDATLTSDTAQYVGALAGKNPFIYAIGNVRAVTRTPDFDPSNPFVTRTRKATIELLPNGGYRMSFDGFEGEGTPLEKPAKSAKPAAGKKP